MKTKSFIEPLEFRIAPAVVINPIDPGTATYTDVDGDKVTIKASAGAFGVVTFASQVSGAGDQLTLIDLRTGGFQGANLTVTVKRVAGGDGVAHIGQILATGIDLGKLTLPGDLGQIDVGDATTSTTALALLKVRSLGLFGIATQEAGGSLVSDIDGPLGALDVAGDVQHASVSVTPTNKPDGRIGSVSIGGSLVGSTVTTNSGQIIAASDIGPVTIGGDLIGGAQNSGQIFAAFGKLTSATIGGSVRGGFGAQSGAIQAGDDMGPVKIGGDLIGGPGDSLGGIIGTNSGGDIESVAIGGSIIAIGGVGGQVSSAGNLGPVTVGGNVVGGGNYSGRIEAAGDVTSVTIGGSLVGGAGQESGILQSIGNLGPVKIGRDIKGSAGENAGRIDAGTRLEALSVGGTIFGGAGGQELFPDRAGQVFAGTGIGAVTIGGDVVGGSGPSSGTIRASGGNLPAVQIESVQIGGSLVGGSSPRSGSVFSAGSIGKLTVAHSVIGGQATDTGLISANGSAIGELAIGGSLVGGGQLLSGAIFARGNLNFVTIGGDVLGGAGERSGYISTFGDLGTISVGGSLVGALGTSSATISANGRIGIVNIAHDLLGTSLAGAVDFSATSAAILSGGAMGTIFIGGSIISGTDDVNGGGFLDRNASIRAGAEIGSLTVRGGIIGNAGLNGDSPVIISAGLPATAGTATIGAIEVGGRVEWTRILAGFDQSLAAANGDAKIGTVTVGGDWIASSLVAGAQNLGADGVPGGTGANADNVNFGNANDTLILAGNMMGVTAGLGSVTIAGQVYGTPAHAGDSFSFVSEQVEAMKVGGRTLVLSSVTQQDATPVTPRADALGHDVSLHEAGAVFNFTLAPGAAPALVNGSTFTFTDSDGDRVTLKLSNPLLTAANVGGVIHLSAGANELRQLQFIDLRPLATNGLGVTLTVVRGATGDGLAHVGAIVATGFDVGALKIPGDLGHILAGDATLTTKGVTSLNVRTLGRLALDTQGPAVAGFTPSLVSDIEGGLGALTVAQDIAQASLDVNGKIGALTLGGSLIGGDAAQSGRIFGRGLGAVKIGLHLQGAPGDESGAIASQGPTTGATIGGSILGSAGDRSGHLFLSFGGPGAVKVVHNVRGDHGPASGQIENATGAINVGGSLLGGYGGLGSGQITTEGRIASVKIGENIVGQQQESGRIFSLSLGSVTVGGSLLGGFNPRSGNIATLLSGGSTKSDIGSVKIAHEIHGGIGIEAGRIVSDGKLGALALGGSLFGGSANYNVNELGQIFAPGAIDKITIGGNLVGGAGHSSAQIRGDLGLGSLTLGGSVVGGGGADSAKLHIEEAIGALKVGRELFGGTGIGAAHLLADDDSIIKSATVGGSIFGGSQFNTGRLSAGSIGTLKIGSDVIGGGGGGAGTIVTTDGKLGSLSIGGSLAGGTSGNTGGLQAAELGAVKLGRNLIGASIAGSAAGFDGAGFILSGDRIGGVTIGGSIFAGFDASAGGALTLNGSIRAADDLGPLVVKGSLHGTSTANGANPVILSARGSETPTATADVAIKSVTIGRRVERALILAGYDTSVDAAQTSLGFANNNAQTGAVSIGRDWLASSLVAGVRDVDGHGFGDADDTTTAGSIARIASIVIRGAVAGTGEVINEHFGFTSVKIGSFKSLAYTAPLTPAKNIIELSLPTADVTIREV